MEHGWLVSYRLALTRQGDSRATARCDGRVTRRVGLAHCHRVSRSARLAGTFGGLVVSTRWLPLGAYSLVTRSCISGVFVVATRSACTDVSSSRRALFSCGGLTTCGALIVYGFLASEGSLVLCGGLRTDDSLLRNGVSVVERLAEQAWVTGKHRRAGEHRSSLCGYDALCR